MLDFSQFDELKKKMGAADSTWKLPPTGITAPDLRLIFNLKLGHDTPLNRVEVKHGGLLAYKGKHVVLYIRDTRLPRSTLELDISNSRRFHIFDCRTIRHMRKYQRFHRYVTTTRTDGYFWVESTEPDTNEVEELEAQLYVCKNCLNELDWKGYQNSKDRERIQVEFSLEEFFAEFSTFFSSKPQYSDMSAPKGGYPKHWPKTTARIKKQNGWRCSKCSVCLSQYKKLLHVHHRNGVLYDMSRRNLQSLCLLCHSEQPYHYLRMNPDKESIELIRRLRREQNR